MTYINSLFITFCTFLCFVIKYLFNKKALLDLNIRYFASILEKIQDVL